MSKKYKNVEDSINRILRDLDLEENERKKYNFYLSKIIEYLENGMKENEVFKELFRQKQYVGSFYENLRIDAPDEFDINFKFIIPKYIGELKVCDSPDPGFCRLYLNEERCSTKPEKDGVKKVVKRWFNEDGYLRRTSVLQWMTSVIDTVFDRYENLTVEDETFEIRRSYSGPAVTLTVTPLSESKHKFSIDFVPVFLFANWPDNVSNIRLWTDDMKYEEWCAVPKSKDENIDTSFRMNFWSQEKELLTDKNQLKPALKLIKKLRDVNDWKGLCSYHIKTVFLLRNDSCELIFWWSKSKSEVFMEMLKDLQNYFLEVGRLPFYWNREFDLWSKLNAKTKENVGNRIKNMIKDIEKNLDEPGYIEKYFKKNDSSRQLVVAPVTEEVPERGGSWLVPALVGVTFGLTAAAAIFAAVREASEEQEQQQQRQQRRRQLQQGDAVQPWPVTEPPHRTNTRSLTRSDSENRTSEDGHECSVM